MKLQSVLTVAAMLLASSLSFADDFTYTFSGEVGSNSSATGALTGTAWGDSAWSYDGNAISAGTEIFFNYAIDQNVLDSDGSATLGRYSGGNLTVSIPTLGVVDVASADSYDLVFLDHIRDEIIFDPASGSGFGLVGMWADGTNPWPDANTLSAVPDTNVQELIGTSPDGNFVLNLANGKDLQTTEFTELLHNATFSSTGVAAVPEPSSLAVLGLASLTVLLRRRRG